jgi:hypothetical protein
MSVLEPIIRDWCKRSGYALGDDATGENSLPSGQVVLSGLSGVSGRRIWAILSGGCYDRSHGNPHFTDRVSFDTADRLLCAMDRVEAWHHELKEWYGPVRVAGYEKDFLQPVPDGMAA